MESATKSNDVRASLGDPPNTRTEANLVSRVPCRRMSARNAMAGGFSCVDDSRLGEFRPMDPVHGIPSDRGRPSGAVLPRHRAGGRSFHAGDCPAVSRRTRGRWIVAVLIFPGIVTYAYAVLQKKMLMEWYVGFMLQGVAVLIAAGAFSPLRKFSFCAMGGTVARDRAAHRFCGAFKSRKRVPADKGRGTLPGIGPRHTLEPRSQCSGKSRNHYSGYHPTALRLRSESAARQHHRPIFGG